MLYGDTDLAYLVDLSEAYLEISRTSAMKTSVICSFDRFLHVLKISVKESNIFHKLPHRIFLEKCCS